MLVTSISPLRAYFYDEGLVRFAAKKYNRNSTKEEEYLTNTSTGKKYVALKLLTWAFKALREWFDGNGYSAAAIFESIHAAVVSLLMASESAFRNHFRAELGGDTCEGCYQLLGVDVMLDEALNPQVIEVNGLPSMQLADDGDRSTGSTGTDAAAADKIKDSLPVANAQLRALVNGGLQQEQPQQQSSSVAAALGHVVGKDGVKEFKVPASDNIDHDSEYVQTKLSLTADIVALVYKPTSVAADLAESLAKLKIGVGPGAFCTQGKHTRCINKAALSHLARGRREYLNRGAFQRIYPSSDGDKHANLALHIHTIAKKKEVTLRAQAQAHLPVIAVKKANTQPFLGPQFIDAWAAEGLGKLNSDVGTTWALHDVSTDLETLWSTRDIAS